MTSSGILLRLPVRSPFNWPQILDWLGRRAIPGIEQVDGGQYRRTFVIDGRHGAIEASFPDASGHLEIRAWLPDARMVPRIEPRLRRLFDLDAETDLIEAHLATDPVLAPLVRAARGLRVPGAWEAFELGIRAILGQQITVAGATSLATRLVARYGTPLDRSGLDLPHAGLTHVFPRPSDLVDPDSAFLRMPRARVRSIAAFAVSCRDRPDVPSTANSLDDIVDELCRLPGFGPWTAHYIAMRAYGQPDAFPASDISLRKAVGMPSAKELLARAEAWRPWRAYAAMHLWYSLSHQSKADLPK